MRILRGNVEENPCYSIIIPCYNVEKYIEKVIFSVETQNFCSYEIIAIDDESTDQSGMILDRFQMNKNHIRVIHQKNSGPGGARNAGLEIARGEYIYFLDGDDRMTEGTLDSVYRVIEQEHPDIIACNYHWYTNWEQSYIREEKLNRTNESKRSMKLQLASDTYLGHNFYRREMLIQNGKPFQVGKKLAEDQEWLLNNIHNANSICVLDKAFYYHYERRPGSQVNSYADDMRIPTIRTWAKMFRDIDGLNYNSNEKNELKHRTSSVFLSLLVRNYYMCENRRLQRELIIIYNENFDIITSPYNKMRIAGRISRVIGITNTLCLCYIYYKLKNRIARKHRNKTA